MSRSVLITGATGKIGRILTRHFLAAGNTVIAAGRSASRLAELTQEEVKAGGILHTVCADLMAESGVLSLKDALQRIGCLPDCLVNNARDASFLRAGPDGIVSRNDFVDELTLDVVLPYEIVMMLANMPGSRLRAVVNIGSQYGIVAPNLKLYADPVKQSVLQYGVAKAALSHLTKELAVRLADRGIRVNCVAFGGVDGKVDEAFKERYAALCPMGRMLREHELAGPVELLLSESASAVTGHTLVADGGWSVW